MGQHLVKGWCDTDPFKVGAQVQVCVFAKLPMRVDVDLFTREDNAQDDCQLLSVLAYL